MDRLRIPHSLRHNSDTVAIYTPELIRNCKRCAGELIPGALVCEQCHALVHSEELERLAADAKALEAKGQQVGATLGAHRSDRRRAGEEQSSVRSDLQAEVPFEFCRLFWILLGSLRHEVRAWFCCAHSHP